MKIVISAQIDLEPAKRKKALVDAKPFIDGALTQDGCLRYDWSEDGNCLLYTSDAADE